MESLWREVSAFMDEEAVCCPFFTFEQVEEPDGVLLRVTGKGHPGGMTWPNTASSSP